MEALLFICPVHDQQAAFQITPFVLLLFMGIGFLFRKVIKYINIWCPVEQAVMYALLLCVPMPREGGQQSPPPAQGQHPMRVWGLYGFRSASHHVAGSIWVQISIPQEYEVHMGP